MDSQRAHHCRRPLFSLASAAAEGREKTASCQIARRSQQSLRRPAGRFDTQHLFSIDEFSGEDRARYHAGLAALRKNGGDLTHWLEYTTEGVRKTLERVWLRAQSFAAKSSNKKTVLRPKQERLLHLLRDQPQGLTPAEIWAALRVTKQGAAHILAPLLKAKLVQRIGTRKTGRYVLG